MEIVVQLVINSIIAGSIYSLIALGFTLVYSTTKFFNLAHGVLAAVGGYAAFYFIKLASPIGPAIFLSIVIAGLTGFLLDKIIFLPLRRRKASDMVLLVASLGAFTAIQAILAILFTSQFQALSAGEVKIYEIFGAAITQVQLMIILAVVVITAILIWMLNQTLFGKAIKAISDDEEVAKIVGINTDKVIGYVFFIGSAIAGLAGVLVGFDTGIEPIMGMPLLLAGVIGAIVGGVGNIYGSLLGSYLLGFVENFGIWFISGEWKSAIAFILLILFLLFRPEGIIKK